MVKGIGVDIVSVERMRRLADAAIARILTPAEEAYCRKHQDPYERIAGRFAAKEAILKALGTGWAQGLGFGQIEIMPDASGAPVAVFSGATAARFADLGATRCHLSISHEKLFAVAYALLE